MFNIIFITFMNSIFVKHFLSKIKLKKKYFFNVHENITVGLDYQYIVICIILISHRN